MGKMVLISSLGTVPKLTCLLVALIGKSGGPALVIPANAGIQVFWGFLDSGATVFSSRARPSCDTHLVTAPEIRNRNLTTAVMLRSLSTFLRVSAVLPDASPRVR